MSDSVKMIIYTVGYLIKTAVSSLGVGGCACGGGGLSISKEESLHLAKYILLSYYMESIPHKSRKSLFGKYFPWRIMTIIWRK